jgi:hypothetical protein
VRYWSEDESRIGLHTMSEKKVNGFRNKTARPSAMGFHLFVALGISRAANRRKIFLRVYTSRYSVRREIIRAICQ